MDILANIDPQSYPSIFAMTQALQVDLEGIRSNQNISIYKVKVDDFKFENGDYKINYSSNLTEN